MAAQNSILRTFARGRHLHQLRIKLAQNGDQIALGRHDLMDVLDMSPARGREWLREP